jgi:hypothetical protein
MAGTTRRRLDRNNKPQQRDDRVLCGAHGCVHGEEKQICSQCLMCDASETNGNVREVT